MAGQDSRVGDRQATSMRIKLKYPDVETFIQKYAVNISRGGIFIATKQPKPVGTYVKFEFLLSNAESQSIIRGEGQVQWTKEFDAANPGKAHGMGVKFMRLDADSQGVVDRALRWRAEHGTSPNATVPTSGTGSSAHAMVTQHDGSQSRRLPSQDLADSEDATTRRRQSERDDLAGADDATTAVREPSQAGGLPVAQAEDARDQAEDARDQAQDPRGEAQDALDRAQDPRDQAQSRRDEGAPRAPTGEGPPPLPMGRRDETRPIAIQHDDEDQPGRAPHQETRPIALSRSAAVRARGGDEIDALASEWGLSEEKLARSLKRARPRMAEATAELERLLLKPPKPPAPSKAEAMTQLAALLEKRAVKGAREPNGSNGAHDGGEAKADEPGDETATDAARAARDRLLRAR